MIDERIWKNSTVCCNGWNRTDCSTAVYLCVSLDRCIHRWKIRAKRNVCCMLLIFHNSSRALAVNRFEPRKHHAFNKQPTDIVAPTCRNLSSCLCWWLNALHVRRTIKRRKFSFHFIYKIGWIQVSIIVSFFVSVCFFWFFDE